MSVQTIFKVTERLGPLGTLSKYPVDYREATLDFTRWLDDDETLDYLQQYGVMFSPPVFCNGLWTVAFTGCACCCEPETATPLGPTVIPVMEGSRVLSGLPQYLFQGGIPGGGYEICNIDPARDLWVTDSGTASFGGLGCYRVPPGGGTYTTPEGYTPLGPVSVIGSLGQFVTARAWGGITIPPPSLDINPLMVVSAHVKSGGKKATVLVGDGTPGFTYAVSFVATVTPSQRRKSVELLVCVGRPAINYYTAEFK